MMTYKDFIKEAERLLNETKRLRNAKRMHEDDDFRRWRNELEGITSQIAQLDYLLPGPVRSANRSYGVSGTHFGTKEELFESYQRDINDTANELRFIIQCFNNHGEPPKQKRDELTVKWPERVTLIWLLHNAPIGLWIKTATSALAIFTGGILFAQTALYKQITDLSGPEPSADASQPKPSKLTSEVGHIAQDQASRNDKTYPPAILHVSGAGAHVTIKEGHNNSSYIGGNIASSNAKAFIHIPRGQQLTLKVTGAGVKIFVEKILMQFINVEDAGTGTQIVET